ncbi:hypothetical protein [Bacillus massilinigeriensis]|uniref:hypothetical protein n=1 Tax=Bacillus massilionigeriensis TaxID=1805475 RepID=UPI00096AFC4D|nr:hypothetical protein [Bacillus massilionigeriensis]
MKKLQPMDERYIFSKDIDSTGEYEFFLEYVECSSDLNQNEASPKVIRNFDELIYFFEEFDRTTY